jgi:hypothetical protein
MLKARESISFCLWSREMGNTSYNQFNLLAQIDKRCLAAGMAAATAGTAVLVPQPADAAVVYSGIVNINIPSTTDGVYLNVVTGAFNFSSPGVAGWDVNPWSSTSLNMFTPTPNAGGGSYVGSGSNYNNVAFGSQIGPASTYGSTGVNTINPATPLNLNSSNNLIGFRFINEANGNAIHYGWMRISLSNTPQSQPRAILDYGWDNVAGTPVSVFPEPGSLALLALGAAGLLRRRQKAIQPK